MFRNQMLLVFGTIFSLAFLSALSAQDSLPRKKGKPVEIFSSGKTINTRTPEMFGAGKMDFNVTHNFGDIAGNNGGIKRFFGLDNASDIRIGFHIGVGKNTELVFARAKGASLVQGLLEFGLKQRFMQQMENDPTRPFSLAFYVNTVIATQKSNTFDNQENSFTNFSDRTSNLLQLIVAKRIQGISLQINPSLLTRRYAISYDQKTMFALGAAIKFPLINDRLNLVLDYFYSFRNKASKDSFRINDNLSFHDPLGVGFEILTSRHIFRLNFTNATEILENRFIPRTITNWGKGEFRWGFTISRNFTLWRLKKQ